MVIRLSKIKAINIGKERQDYKNCTALHLGNQRQSTEKQQGMSGKSKAHKVNTESHIFSYCPNSQLKKLGGQKVTLNPK